MKKKLNITLFIISILIVLAIFFSYNLFAASPRQMENLDRGVVAVKVSNGVFLSWRAFGTESMTDGYNIYRGSTKINSSPITGATNYTDTSGTTSSTYSVSAVINGQEQVISQPVNTWGNNYLNVPLSRPGSNYIANDCSVGDLDNDGKYEIVLKWEPDDAKDNSQGGVTSNVYLDGYELDGTRLWRINLGRNIRAGAHYTQFMVYDLDGDGDAEVACKIADATVDGTGKVFGDANADYRNSDGYILSGPEYLGIFSGGNGGLLEYASYDPPRGTVSAWGDSYGNRVDRFLACIAYLDGTRPSLVMCRGYYTRTVLAAWDYRGGNLTKRWTFDSNNNTSYAGQGNHNLSVADIDSDGKDEIIYGACTIDDNGTGLYNSGLGHGDAMHVGDLNPSRSGLEIWSCFESNAVGAALRDARTGSIIFRYNSDEDVGRACCADITASYPGEEMWASSGCPLYSSTGQNIGSVNVPINFAIWWDGDVLRELLDGTTISKYNQGTLLSASGCASNNGTKATPCLSADILGDWREEVIFRTSDNNNLRIYTTTNTTSRKIYTLMHDPVYRLGIAWQNVAYNQPPHTSFFLGDGMSNPPVPSINLVGNGGTYTNGPANTSTPVVTVNPQTANPNQTEFQAEDAYISEGVVETEHTGYTGSGYVNLENNTTSYIEFTLNSSISGSKQMTLRYANGSGADRPMEISVNGNVVNSSLSFPDTVEWTSWNTQTVNVNLNSGINKIRLKSTTDTGGPNLDKIDLPQGTSTPTTNGTCGDVNSSGGTDIADALLISQYYVGGNPANFNQGVADVNGDGSVNIQDALLVAQYYVGIINTLSCN